MFVCFVKNVKFVLWRILCKNYEILDWIRLKTRGQNRIFSIFPLLPDHYYYDQHMAAYPFLIRYIQYSHIYEYITVVGTDSQVIALTLVYGLTLTGDHTVRCWRFEKSFNSFETIVINLKFQNPKKSFPHGFPWFFHAVKNY